MNKRILLQLFSGLFANLSAGYLFAVTISNAPKSILTNALFYVIFMVLSYKAEEVLQNEY